MKTTMKTSVIMISIAMLFSISSGNAETPRECRAAYRACLADGYPANECEDGYYYCLYGYLPVKSAATPVADRRRD